MKKQKVEFSKGGSVRYIINENAGIVFATLTCSKTEPQQQFLSIFKSVAAQSKGSIEEIIIPQDFDVFDVMIDQSYTGVAKCHPDDKFNLEFGKALALQRAKEKHADSLLKQSEKIRHFLGELYNSFMQRDVKNYRHAIDLYSEERDMLRKVGAVED